MRAQVDYGCNPLDEGIVQGTNGVQRPTKGGWQSTNDTHMSAMLPVLLTALLGIGNFALHKAVLESRHRILDQMPALLRSLGGRASLLAEFVLLLGALLLVAYGHTGWGLAYLCYTVLNGFSAWLILSRRF